MHAAQQGNAIQDPERASAIATDIKIRYRRTSLLNVSRLFSVQTSSKSSEAAREAGLLATRHQGPFVLYFSPHCHGSATEACMVEFSNRGWIKASRPLGLNDGLINVQKRICSFLHFLLFVTTPVRPASMLTMVLPFTARTWPWPMPSTRRTEARESGGRYTVLWRLM